MKMKRFVSFVLAFVLILSLVPVAFAADKVSDAQDAADKLYELGLFKGTGTDAAGKPTFELDRAPNRQEAVTMLVRLLGKEEEALAGTWTTPFTDVEEWAKPYVGYAYENKLTNGTGATTFGGSETVTATQYLTFVLRALGYESGTDFQWDKAWEKTDEIGLTNGEYNASTTTFLRGDVAMVSYNSLSVGINNNDWTLAQKVGIGNKPITVENLQGIWNNDGASEGRTTELVISDSYVKYISGYSEVPRFDFEGTFVLEDNVITISEPKSYNTLLGVISEDKDSGKMTLPILYLSDDILIYSQSGSGDEPVTLSKVSSAKYEPIMTKLINNYMSTFTKDEAERIYNTVTDIRKDCQLMLNMYVPNAMVLTLEASNARRESWFKGQQKISEMEKYLNSIKSYSKQIAEKLEKVEGICNERSIPYAQKMIDCCKSLEKDFMAVSRANYKDDGLVFDADEILQGFIDASGRFATELKDLMYNMPSDGTWSFGN